MSHRTIRVWLGATRTVVLSLVLGGLLLSAATQAYGYMPPPIPRPNILPDELPGEGQQRIDGQLPDRSQLAEQGMSIPTDGNRSNPWAGRLIDRILEILRRLAGSR